MREYIGFITSDKTNAQVIIEAENISQALKEAKRICDKITNGKGEYSVMTAFDELKKAYGLER